MKTPVLVNHRALRRNLKPAVAQFPVGSVLACRDFPNDHPGLLGSDRIPPLLGTWASRLSLLPCISRETNGTLPYVVQGERGIGADSPRTCTWNARHSHSKGPHLGTAIRVCHHWHHPQAQR